MKNKKIIKKIGLSIMITLIAVGSISQSSFAVLQNNEFENIKLADKSQNIILTVEVINGLYYHKDTDSLNKPGAIPEDDKKINISNDEKWEYISKRIQNPDLNNGLGFDKKSIIRPDRGYKNEVKFYKKMTKEGNYEDEIKLTDTFSTNTTIYAVFQKDPSQYFNIDILGRPEGFYKYKNDNKNLELLIGTLKWYDIINTVNEIVEPFDSHYIRSKENIYTLDLEGNEKIKEDETISSLANRKIKKVYVRFERDNSKWCVIKVHPGKSAKFKSEINDGNEYGKDKKGNKIFIPLKLKSDGSIENNQEKIYESIKDKYSDIIEPKISENEKAKFKGISDVADGKNIDGQLEAKEINVYVNYETEVINKPDKDKEKREQEKKKQEKREQGKNRDQEKKEDNVKRTTIRINGSNRVKTAIEVSKKIYPKGSENIILANMEKYSDVLTASPFANQVKAPILFTNNKVLNNDTKEEIKRLGAKSVYIIGGNQSVSESTEAELKKDGINVTRVSGIDRYETARKIAIKVREKGNKDTLEIASGESFPDALSMSSLAIKENAPILLSKNNELPNITKKSISDWNIKNVNIAGSNKTISNKVESEIKNNSKNSINIKRYGGKDRYETSVIISKAAFQKSDKAVYTSGENFADALVSGSFAAHKSAPVLLVKKEMVPFTVKEYTEKMKVKDVFIIGGKSMIDDKILDMINKPIKK
ncbi:cell wall-binding repeat-containing protein [Peptostreptococcus canis]|uniref:Cell wall binding repeat 2 n=1 Tax=Peptostreptococcus canis TaxID=1159213 RepID=A0ABR6TMK1_9FIRM|nr:cell wall-binding repeat-containing protein [Peptostreptococcus canis]MBC2576643.1 hypothetical protein [Peptostreptococcus canis]MBP1998607.1 putative cell wall-binding protein [Peptostreptococcus canis]